MIMLMVSIVIVLGVVVFAVQNAAMVPVDFLVWSAELPLAVVIFCSVFAGALLMFCLFIWRELKNKINRRSQEKMAKQNKKEEKKVPEITANAAAKPAEIPAAEKAGESHPTSAPEAVKGPIDLSRKKND